MEINRKFSIFSALVAVAFLVTAVSVSSAWAAPAKEKQISERAVQKTGPRRLTATGQPAKPKVAQPQAATSTANPVNVCYSGAPYWNGTGYTWSWSVPATAYSAPAGETCTACPVPSAAPPPRPTYTPGAVQAKPATTAGNTATVCYNPYYPGWNVPACTWNQPATAGSSGQGIVQRLEQFLKPPAQLPPPPVPPGVPQAAATNPGSGSICYNYPGWSECYSW